MVKRGEVYWVELDPTVGSEIRKTRPCLIISPDDMNAVLPRVIIAPITTKGQPLGCRPELVFNGKQSRILLDQVRTVDARRLKNKMGKIELEHWHSILIQMLS
ncbi:type II toxin-antitoxin system PemK/MazF family toxin [Zhongshania aliphaticivorans]|uniref:type II toxin-antitoxin system PemK/MazF family toxin n=1 Tax=Zhongshania aliphaticivorans TaxID=1470434 RepID=UPI0012E653CF|nr:type II toxin-antitoxin system PemK/MazF family toxin [Zhongshania aliphaticivorans]CAA0118103.1 Endoribonuclease EndoA [Zhongshania aliphaticivorans]